MPTRARPASDTPEPVAGGSALLDARARAAIARFRPENTALSRFMIRGVIGISRWIMLRRNSLDLVGAERFAGAAARGGRGLLTFSNHVSLLDDPLVLSCFPVGGPETVRWVAADAHNFFGDPLRGAVFGRGRCVPIVRGAGEEQPGFAFLRDRLAAGDWVHIFPEGGRTRDPDARIRAGLKAGIGRLIDETRPLVLPFYHYGMHEILPVGGRFPARGKRVRVEFGPVVDCDDAFIARTAGETTARARWARIAAWAWDVLRSLEDAVRGPPER